MEAGFFFPSFAAMLLIGGAAVEEGDCLRLPLTGNLGRSLAAVGRKGGTLRAHPVGGLLPRRGSLSAR